MSRIFTVPGFSMISKGRVMVSKRQAASPGPGACRWLRRACALAAGLALSAGAGAAGAAGAAPSGVLEVFHTFDTGPDALAAAYLKTTVRDQGYVWKDFTIAGGGAGLASSMLRSRVLSGNPPTVALIKAMVARDWARRDALVPLDDLARAEHWDAVLPKVIADDMKAGGHYAAIPLGIHRLNWLWINEAIFRQAGARVPSTWDEFFAAADLIKKSGHIAVAHGGLDWHNMLLFETVVLGTGGPDYYRKALVERDRDALTAPAMRDALRTFRRIKSYTVRSPNAPMRSRGAARLAGGAAGMHLIGDWDTPGLDGTPVRFPYTCVPAPGSAGSYSYTVDSFALFRTADASQRRMQRAFASDIMSPVVQREFSLRKGAIPARTGVSLDGFGPCARASNAAFQAAAQAGTLVPAVAMVASPELESTLRDIVSAYWNDERVTPEETMRRLAAAARLR